VIPHSRIRFSTARSFGGASQAMMGKSVAGSAARHLNDADAGNTQARAIANREYAFITTTVATCLIECNADGTPDAGWPSRLIVSHRHSRTGQVTLRGILLLKQPGQSRTGRATPRSATARFH